MGEFHQMLSYTFRNNFFATFIKSTKKVACNFHKSNEEICCSQNQGALKQSFGWTSMKKCLQRIITTFYFEVWTLSKTLPLWSIDDSGWTSLRCQWRSTSLDPSIHSHGVALREHFTKPPNLKKNGGLILFSGIVCGVAVANGQLEVLIDGSLVYEYNKHG